MGSEEMHVSNFVTELLSRLEAAVCSRKAWKRWEAVIQVTVCGCRGINDELQLQSTSVDKPAPTHRCRFFHIPIFFFFFAQLL